MDDVTKRRHRRQTLIYPALIELPGNPAPVNCNILDISEAGARIETRDSESLPQIFELLLAGSGGPRRHCQVIWRKEHELGVEFEIKPAAPRRRR